jgi:hypothetical protein
MLKGVCGLMGHTIEMRCKEHTYHIQIPTRQVDESGAQYERRALDKLQGYDGLG